MLAAFSIHKESLNPCVHRKLSRSNQTAILLDSDVTSCLELSDTSVIHQVVLSPSDVQNNQFEIQLIGTNMQSLYSHQVWLYTSRKCTTPTEMCSHQLECQQTSVKRRGSASIWRYQCVCADVCDTVMVAFQPTPWNEMEHTLWHLCEVVILQPG